MKSSAALEVKSERSHRTTIGKRIIATTFVALMSGVIIGSASYAATGSTDAYFKWAQKSARESLAGGRTADAAWWEAQAEKAYFRERNSLRGELVSSATNSTPSNALTYVSNRGQQR